MAFEAYGLRIGIRTNASDFLPRLAAAIPAHWKPIPQRDVDWLYSVTFGGAVSLFLKMHDAFVAVVPAATVAVAVLPLNVQFVPVPESNV